MSKFSLAALIAKHKAGKNKPAATAEELENLAELKADLAASQASLEEVIAAHATLETELSTAQAALNAAECDLKAQATAHTAALEALEADVAKRADAKALDLLAAQSVPSSSLPAAEPNKSAGQSKELSLEEFKALSDAEKVAFSVARGRII